MNKWIKRILLTLLFLAVFAGVGLAGYQIGLRQGLQANGEIPAMFFHRYEGSKSERPDKLPPFHPNIDNRGFHHGNGFDRFGSFDHGRGFGYFSPFGFLFKFALLGILIWFGYNLFKGNGWHLSLTRHVENTTNDATPAAPKRKSARRSG